MKNKKIPFNPILSALLWLGTILITSSAIAEHREHSGHEHVKHQGPSSKTPKAGPNGGRIVQLKELKFEFFVRPDRLLQITLMDESGNLIAPEGQSFYALTGNRTSPVKLDFTAQKDQLLSSEALPEGANLPIILNFKTSANAKLQRVRFNVNLSSCSGCPYLEYACTCKH